VPGRDSNQNLPYASRVLPLRQLPRLVKVIIEYSQFLLINALKKGKAIPVTGRGGPEGCETSRLPHFLDNRLTDGGDVVSLTRLPPFMPRKFSVRGWVCPRAIVRLEGLGQLKNPMASSGIEPATLSVNIFQCVV
jgi:hypothetical protein